MDSLSKDQSATDRFLNSILPSDQDDVMQRIEECAWYDRKDEHITILNLEKFDQLNIMYSGYILYNDFEHTFIIQSGNYAGTEIISWNDEAVFDFSSYQDIAEIPYPNGNYVDDVIKNHNEQEFLKKWEKLKNNTELKEIISSYHYDRYFACSHSINSYWINKMNRFNIHLISKKEASIIQIRLKNSIYEKMVNNG